MTLNKSQIHFPQRIICLTEETTEALYMMGEEDRIVGISSYTVRPARAKQEKPKVSAFIDARIEKIIALEPDLVLAFSDMQADIVKQLIQQGIQVHCFNHRTVKGILQMIQTLAALIGEPAKGQKLIHTLQQNIARIEAKVAQLSLRPKVYFEEWDEPIITGIGWVSEIVTLAGGNDCYPSHAQQSLAKHRIIEHPEDVIAHQPDIIMAAWCGKKFQPQQLIARPGWQSIPAVMNAEVHEIESSIILQPGPAALTDGINAVYAVIEQWHQRQLAATDIKGNRHA
ncbi:cobalamin-binding protein [Motilimonas pumila]|uniref:Cobalamin-binding protein n=1 Tax=Motilimonas pumila TaxID=2303987 RepID=A0A418YC65_9GAMM|nr:cobalamin-binding protein [Motilimonas pumila]RJG42105.1 cobalamin-binding protein [Motilimonas pumila]